MQLLHGDRTLQPFRHIHKLKFIFFPLPLKSFIAFLKLKYYHVRFIKWLLVLLCLLIFSFFFCVYEAQMSVKCGVDRWIKVVMFCCYWLLIDAAFPSTTRSCVRVETSRNHLFSSEWGTLGMCSKFARRPQQWMLWPYSASREGNDYATKNCIDESVLCYVVHTLHNGLITCIFNWQSELCIDSAYSRPVRFDFSATGYTHWRTTNLFNR